MPTRTTSQCSLGERDSTVPPPSTWPCTTCPPRRPPALTARSRLTGSPPARPPRLLRRSVSAITSVDQTDASPSGSTPVTVRQTPLTEMESPRDTSCRTRRARMRSTAASDESSRAARVPTSSTIPVNTSAPLLVPRSLPSVPGGPQADLHVPAQQGDVAHLQRQRRADRADSQVPHQGGAGAEQLRCQVDDGLVDEPGAQERGGQRRAPLEQHPAHVAVEQLGEQPGRAGGRR